MYSKVYNPSSPKLLHIQKTPAAWYRNDQSKLSIGFPPVSTPAGRLLYLLANWEKLTTDQLVLQIVKDYKMSLKCIPQQWRPGTNHVALDSNTKTPQ